LSPQHGRVKDKARVKRKTDKSKDPEDGRKEEEARTYATVFSFQLYPRALKTIPGIVFLKGGT